MSCKEVRFILAETIGDNGDMMKHGHYLVRLLLNSLKIKL